MKNRQRKKFNRVNARKSWAKKFEGMLLSARYKPSTPKALSYYQEKRLLS